MINFLRKQYRAIFYFLLLIPVCLLVFEIRKTLIETRDMQKELYILHRSSASHQRTILGLQTRVLHYAEDHTEGYMGCPLCFKNLIREEYDHEAIKRFLQQYRDGSLIESIDNVKSK